MNEVQLNLNNYSKCLCPVCPVQKKNRCIEAKKEKWIEMRKKFGEILEEYAFYPETYEMEMKKLEKNWIGRRHDFKKPPKEEMIELYCSKAIGRSECQDLNINEKCQCPDCAVWYNKDLRGTYFCHMEF